MKHLRQLSKVPAVAASPLTIKLQGALDIIDRLLLAQRQAAWKVPFPIDWEGGTDTDTGIDTGTGTGTL